MGNENDANNDESVAEDDACDKYTRAARVLKKFSETIEALDITELSDVEKARDESINWRTCSDHRDVLLFYT